MSIVVLRFCLQLWLEQFSVFIIDFRGYYASLFFFFNFSYLPSGCVFM
jgi:hypothetical protein